MRIYSVTLHVDATNELNAVESAKVVFRWMNLDAMRAMAESDAVKLVPIPPEQSPLPRLLSAVEETLAYLDAPERSP